MTGEAMKEFLRQADAVAADTAHRGPVAFDRAFVARVAADLRVVAGLFTMLERESLRITREQRAGVGDSPSASAAPGDDAGGGTA